MLSDSHPHIGIAYDVHSNHLADSAIEYRKFGGDQEKLRLRSKQQRTRDKKLMDAKDMLVNFANSLDANQVMSMENLLK